MTTRILILGAGAFAREIALALPAAWAGEGDQLSVHITSREVERAQWLALLGNSRSRALHTKASFQAHYIDWNESEYLSKLIDDLSPSAIIHTASLQSAWMLRPGTAWFHLVRHGGYGVTAAFQGALFPYLRNAIKGADYQGALVNACYPDMMNAAAKYLGLTITCGLGNIALISEQLREYLKMDDGLRVLAGHWDVEQSCRPASDRLHHPLVWINDEPVNTSRILQCPSLSGDSSMNALSAGVSGAVIRALVKRETLRGVHLPGIKGLPGGYPVVIESGSIEIDLPSAISLAEAECWLRDRSERDGAFLTEAGFVAFSEPVSEMLKSMAPDLARGFEISDIEEASREFTKLRMQLELVTPSDLGWAN